jgi:hypothetical protein
LPDEHPPSNRAGEVGFVFSAFSCSSKHASTIEYRIHGCRQGFSWGGLRKGVAIGLRSNWLSFLRPVPALAPVMLPRNTSWPAFFRPTEATSLTREIDRLLLFLNFFVEAMGAWHWGFVNGRCARAIGGSTLFDPLCASAHEI